MTVSDIAREAGVSITTVSRVLNNSTSVRPETALQVRKVLEQFPYDPHAIRRGPRPGKRRKPKSVREMRNNAVAIVVLGRSHEKWFKQPVFASIVSAINRAATDRHLAVRIEEVLDANRVPDCLHRDVVDGALVFIATTAGPELLPAVCERVPTVRIMGDDLIPSAIDRVRVDNLEIGQLAYQYLISNGCKRLACVTSRLDHGSIFMRTVAFTAAAARDGLGQPLLYTVGSGPAKDWCGVSPTVCQSFDEVALDLAARSPVPTGLFVTQDIETIGLYSSLASHGLRPGQDLKLISCNNDESLSLLHPRPATIDLDPPAIGRWALRRLINRISRPDDAPIQMLIKPSLVLPDGDGPL